MALPFFFSRNDNKMMVIQSIIIHDVIGRPKIVLDQLRDGLAILGFGEKMKNNPDLFQKLFVLAETELSPADVIDVLEFPASVHDDYEEATTKGYLIAFLQAADTKVLQKFLIHTTGAPCLPNFGLGKITVKFESDDPSVFASACLNSLSLPKRVPNQEVFSPSLEAIINTASKSFNCV